MKNDICPFRLFIYTGNSMLLTFEPEDKLICKRYSSSMQISIGDVIIYSANDKVVAHRVVWKARQKIFTRGDNNLTFMDSEAVSFHQIYGKVVSYVRQGLYYRFDSSITVLLKTLVKFFFKRFTARKI